MRASAVISFIIRLLEWPLDYTGPLAELVKTIPVVLMALAIFSPVYTYPFWIQAGIAVGTPWNYIVYAVYIFLHFILLPALAIAVGYVRERRNR